MPKHKKEFTFLELMEKISEAAKNDDEVLATVTHLVNSGRVRFGGNLARAKIATRPTLAAFLNKVRSEPSYGTGQNSLSIFSQTPVMQRP